MMLDARLGRWWRAFSRVATCAVALRGGCFDVPGNDPNVPDLLPEVADTGIIAMPCSTNLPNDCTTTPSYSKEIAALIQAHCEPCHAAGGVASDRNLTTYGNVEKIESTVLGQVYGCMMPPADAGPDAMLTQQERNDLLQWLVCNSPNN
jgi:hypothetical protein